MFQEQYLFCLGAFFRKNFKSAVIEEREDAPLKYFMERVEAAADDGLLLEDADLVAQGGGQAVGGVDARGAAANALLVEPGDVGRAQRSERGLGRVGGAVDRYRRGLAPAAQRTAGRSHRDDSRRSGRAARSAISSGLSP